MQDLIDRLQKATGATLKLSHDIAVHFGTYDKGSHQWPNYTASIDAARELVPHGLYWMVGLGKRSEAEPLGGAATFRPGEDDPLTLGEHAEPAIALCIAALKAIGGVYREDR